MNIKCTTSLTIWGIFLPASVTCSARFKHIFTLNSLKLIMNSVRTQSNSSPQNLYYVFFLLTLVSVFILVLIN